MKKLSFLIMGLFALSCSRGAIQYAGASSPRGVRMAPAVPLELHVFETGTMRARARSVYKGGKKKVYLDQPAYLIKHPTQGMVMFEAGFSPEVSTGGRKYVGVFLYTTGLLRMDQQPGQDARTQIKAAGINADEIGMIAVSHFHPEHGGAVEYFPEAGVVTDQREFDYIMGKPKYNFFDKEFDKVEKWLKVDFAGSRQFGPFEGYVDLFGDGTVTLVSTPGHTPGHISLVVRLPEGPVLLTGDVAWHQGNIDSESIGVPFVSVSGKGARESLGRLLVFKKDYPEFLIVPGHDLSPLRNAKRADVTFHAFPPASAGSPPPKPEPVEDKVAKDEEN